MLLEIAPEIAFFDVVAVFVASGFCLRAACRTARYRESLGGWPCAAVSALSRAITRYEGEVDKLWSIRPVRTRNVSRASEQAMTSTTRETNDAMRHWLS